MGLPSIEDYRVNARRSIPRFAFDLLDGGAGSEAGLARNRRAFERVTLRPRVLTGNADRNMSATLFGKGWSAPFGIGPIGLANIVWPGTDLRAAKAARDAGIPYVLSAAGSTAVEDISRATSAHAWFQLYVGADDEVVMDLVKRAGDAGCEVLLVTVDVPAPGRRHRDVRNGLALPLRPSLKLASEIIAHPRWAFATLRAGAPKFMNYEPYLASGQSSQSLASFMSDQISARFDWPLLAHIRNVWKRTLVVKGILDPRDAVAAKDAGADGIVISNHGGRQLESAPATLDVLPEIRAAVGVQFPILIDSGFRSGEDIVKGLALGADFVLLGRAIMYAAATGSSGVADAIALVKAEIDCAMAQIGIRSLRELGAHAVRYDSLARHDEETLKQ